MTLWRVSKSKQVMEVQHDTVAHKRNPCNSVNTTMHFVCVFELYVSVNYIKIFSVAQQYFDGKFMPQATIKLE